MSSTAPTTGPPLSPYEGLRARRTLAVRLGGTASGEHGLGVVKGGALARQWPPRAHALHRSVKETFDPRGLLNPGKKL